MSRTRRRLKLTFETDWHIGTGAGIPGSVDRQVLRDANGLPYVPGKTLTGILRDAAEWVADTRDAFEEGANKGKWRKAVDSLFGHQPETHGGAEGEEAQPAKIGVGSAELAQEVRDCIRAADAKGLDLSSALFKVHPGVKINPETGRALDDHLFSTERVRWDCVLYADVTCLSELTFEEKELLKDAIRAVRHIGGKRRRGAGVCKLELDNTPPTAKQTGNSEGMKSTINPDGSVTLDIRLTARQPIIINRKNVGNAIETDTEIPGTALLSYYATEVLKPLGEDCLKDAIMKGDISAGTFLPEFKEEQALPAPLCLAAVKETGKPVNRLVEAPEGVGQMKDIRSGYVVPTENGMEYYAASDQKVIRTHNTIDDSVQRPTETVGGLFTYEAIRAGQKFRGTLKIGANLWGKIKENEDILRKLAYDEHTFGRSRKDEYGLAHLECVLPQEGEAEGTLSPTTPLGGRTDKATGKYLVVYLVSDLLLRGEALGYSVRVEDVRKALQKKLFDFDEQEGQEPLLKDIPEDEWTEKKQKDGRDILLFPLGGTRGHSIRTGRRESWQVSWGLPRPSLVYFKAGSVFLFKVTKPEEWNEEKAKALIKDGLGERRAEGYGQVLLNPPFLCREGAGVKKLEALDAPGPQGDGQSTSDEGKGKDKGRDTIKLPSLPSNEEDKKLILKLAKDVLRRRFCQVARREAYDIVHGKNDPLFGEFPAVLWGDRPSASQFGALREAAATISDEPNGMDIFRDWVNGLARPDKEKQHWKPEWIAMLQTLGGIPKKMGEDAAPEVPGKSEKIWKMREGFENLKKAFEGALPSEEIDELGAMSPSLLGTFLDILCEAVFDKAREPGQDDAKGGDANEP